MIKSIIVSLLTILTLSSAENTNANYVCSTHNNNVYTDYISSDKIIQFNVPIDLKQTNTDNVCLPECVPCFPYIIDSKVYNIGYYAECKLSGPENLKAGLLEEPDEKPDYILPKLPLDQVYSKNLLEKIGVFETDNTMNKFVSKYKLCIQDHSKALVNKVIIPAIKKVLTTNNIMVVSKDVITDQASINSMTEEQNKINAKKLDIIKNRGSIRQQIIKKIKSRFGRKISDKERRIQKFYEEFYRLKYLYKSQLRKYNKELRRNLSAKDEKELEVKRKKVLQQLLKLKSEYNFIHHNINKINHTNGLYTFF
jgi:hypothetical protein